MMAAKLRSISDTGFADIENTQQLTLMSQQSLARIFLKVSLSLHPTGMQDDKYIDVFCICHPEDTTFSSANQCYQLEYHSASKIIGFDRHHSTHPIRPSSSSTFWTVRSGRTVTTISSVNQTRQLWHLHNNIHGPFDFASVNGRRTETVLHRRIGSKYYKFQYLFSEYVPSLELPTRTSTLNIISVLSMYFDTAWTIGLQNITHHSCVACGGIMFCPGLSTPSLYRLSDIKHTPQKQSQDCSVRLIVSTPPFFYKKEKRKFE